MDDLEAAARAAQDHGTPFLDVPPATILALIARERALTEALTQIAEHNPTDHPDPCHHVTGIARAALSEVTPK
jgi:hypothetical protein